MNVHQRDCLEKWNDHFVSVTQFEGSHVMSIVFYKCDVAYGDRDELNCNQQGRVAGAILTQLMGNPYQ